MPSSLLTALTSIHDSRKETVSPSPTAEAATGAFQQRRFAKKRFHPLTLLRLAGPFRLVDMLRKCCEKMEH